MTGVSEERPAPSIASLEARALEAARHWGLGSEMPVLLKYRENAVFRIMLTSGEPAALRLHRPGYHDEAALASELAWMSTLRDAGLRVPAPIPTPDGRTIVALSATADFDSQHADIVSWMSGRPIGQSGVPLAQSRERQVEIFRALGEAMAQLHAAADGWTPPEAFRRPSWDRDGLVGDCPLWGRFWDCPGLLSEEARSLTALRQSLMERIASDLPDDLDYGLIHADLVRENVLVDGPNIELIDFDDAGHGWRMFDIATALFKNRSEPHFEAIKAALIAGYRSRQVLADRDLKTLPLFMVLRAVTYIGWLGERPQSPDAEKRMRGYVADALATADDLGGV